MPSIPKLLKTGVGPRDVRGERLFQDGVHHPLPQVKPPSKYHHVEMLWVGKDLRREDQP